MTKTITFNTGRGYSKGQIIKAIEHGNYNNIDWFDYDNNIDQYIIFEDITRGIKGKIKFCALNELSIMKNYDSGNYQDI